ncbi:hypothetical protein GCL60_11000 [Silvanigrella paludirubra]|uniref:Tripartite tricarboxylate transporter substrate binding protein n=1 Tax=Silvanigrella paludirubra TaxID=2499159 RepID=A0A6N6VQ63_9BACT|nr:tripartite tricarboxylate transporter substrate-binding protein [Silvanigrella paludirubra]KAB8037694.1 hypothetical protein GCL60_11000 [Silvanigrella paludirubra]
MIKKFKIKNFYKLFICYIGYPVFGVYSLNSFAIENNLKIIIPAEKNGGNDYIARKIGEFLNDEKIIKKIQYENISGIGASKGIEEFLKMNANENGFLIASLGAHVNDLQGNLSQDKDLLKKLTPLAIISEDYPIIAVNRSSSFKNEEELMQEFKKNKDKFKVYGGSKEKGIDHINFLLTAKKYDLKSSEVQYVESNGGGKAFDKFLQDENGILSTSFSENIKNIVDKKIKILAICSDKRLKECPNAPTFKELGISNCLMNYRIIYINSKSSPEKIKFYNNIIDKLFTNLNWLYFSKDNHIININVKSKDIQNFIEQKRDNIQKIIFSLNEK